MSIESKPVLAQYRAVGALLNVLDTQLHEERMNIF